MRIEKQPVCRVSTNNLVLHPNVKFLFSQDPVPVTFHGKVYGKATDFFRDGDIIFATIELQDSDVLINMFGLVLYPAISGLIVERDTCLIKKIEVTNIALSVFQDTDQKIPPIQIKDEK